MMASSRHPARREDSVRRQRPADRESPWQPLAAGAAADAPAGAIAAVVAHPRFRGCSWLRFADGTSLIADAAIVAGLGLAPGDAPCPRRWRELLVREAAHRARQDGIRLLALRPRTVRDLGLSLQRRKHEPEAVAAALEALQQLGLLCDADYARNLVAQAAVARGWGSRRVMQELIRRGVPAAVSAMVLAELVDPADAFQAAATLARKRWTRLAALPPPVAGRRLAAYLQRRGFAGDVIWQAVRSVLESD